MNSHALRVLEFDRVLEVVAAYAVTPLGKSAFAALEPLDDPGEVEVRLSEAREIGLLAESSRIPLAGFKDVATLVRQVAEGGRPCEPDLLYDVLLLLRGSVSLRETLSRQPTEYPALTRLAIQLVDYPELRSEIEHAIDARDGVRDEATPRLRGIRRDLRRLRESIRERIHKRAGNSRLQKALQTEGIKFKNDRYMLSVKAEFRQTVPGVIRDRSHSGSTLYIEPEDLVLEGDALLGLIDDERDEVRKILWDLTRKVLRVESGLRTLQVVVSQIDQANAKATYAKAFRLVYPEIVQREPGDAIDLSLTEARHPYLMWLNRDVRRDIHDIALEDVHSKAVPLDVTLGSPHRLIIVTGPNTGGKTVALKTIGLCIVMALSGIPVPAVGKPRIPWISNLFADIGDEQSIEQNLSTFSSHLTNLVEILRDGDSNSFVLLDELGAGTDPLEGAALATSLLQWFKDQGWAAVITTHLSSLKEFAFLNDEVENAAMEFDAKTLEPTFRMITGIPGRSHALEIARRLGVSEAVVAPAEERVHASQAPTREVIEKMVESRRRMDKEHRRMQRLRQRAQDERRAAVSEREEAEFERQALRREADALCEETVRDAKDRLLPVVRQLQNVPKSLVPVVEELRCMIELLLTATPLGKRREEFARALRKEDIVYVPKFRESCKVRKINKSDRVVTVLLNGIPTAVSFDDVSWVDSHESH
jgi:DNA mismatch repair protein MutS2